MVFQLGYSTHHIAYSFNCISLGELFLYSMILLIAIVGYHKLFLAICLATLLSISYKTLKNELSYILKNKERQPLDQFISYVYIFSFISPCSLLISMSWSFMPSMRSYSFLMWSNSSAPIYISLI